MLCPCGSTQRFEYCCNKYIAHEAETKTAEQLMRSRYSAYATGAFDYIFNTYGKEQRETLSIETLSEHADEQQWVNLDIHHAQEETLPAIVEFSAFYLIGNTLHELRECSRFERQDGHIRYLDGDIIKHEKVKTLSRNDLCPCNSGKKFKKCCN